ncbi:hypothetical protein HK102_000102 [Quaeritorhiza haematococci]|nr:hypothetical protein HK102_000102 [Quaeritorhiza haematococci]
MAATDHYTRIHQVLKLSHDVLRRGAHQMGEYAPKVSNDEAPAFVGYSLAFLSNLLSHHDMEEQVRIKNKIAIFGTTIFVTSKIPGVSTRHDEHVKLAELMGAFKAYLEGVQSGSEQWSAEKYMSLFTSVKDLVLPHVTAEESDLTPEVLKTALNDAEAEVLVRDLAAAGKGSGERTL